MSRRNVSFVLRQADKSGDLPLEAGGSYRLRTILFLEEFRIPVRDLDWKPLKMTTSEREDIIFLARVSKGVAHAPTRMRLTSNRWPSLHINAPVSPISLR